jgi:hypothetical protein
MREIQAIRCQSCGGTVAARVGALPACLFCGNADLVPFEPPESIEAPVGFIPFQVSSSAARETFKVFAKSSIWYPNDLRQAKLELKQLQLPAWAWSGDLETHWTGLVSANTRSGKRPVAGAEKVHFDQILVPSSASLKIAELRDLGRYDEAAMAEFDPNNAEDPYEISELTRSAAMQKAQAEMEIRHRAVLQSQKSISVLKTSCVSHNLDGKPVLVPVYIGAYTYGRGLYRILVNGQTGKLIGDAPISYWKVAGAILLGLLVIAGIAAAVSVCFGAGGLAVAINV